MVQIRYFRSDKQRVDHVTLLFPDTQSLAVDDDTWANLGCAITEQYKAKVALVDEMKIEEEDEEVGEDEKMEQGGEEKNIAATIDSKEVEEQEEEAKHVDVKESIVLLWVEQHENDVSMTSEGDEKPAELADGEKPTNWSKLDPKSMKVAELRVELELRNLETKGIKTLLVQRLQTALDSEKANEAKNSETKDSSEVSVKQEGGDENPAAFIAPSAEEVRAKTEAEAKKEQEINDKKKKKEEQLEKEKKEKKETLEKHYQLPEEKKVLVFPSKTFKSGKFDCKVQSLSSLLDYRSDDNKENQFEISLFAEAFKEMLERNSAFTIYETLVNCGDRDAERKRREEAREKPVEVPKEENAAAAAAGTTKSEKDGEKEEKDIIPMERIELKSIVANRTVYEAFSLFDTNLCGYLSEKDVEDILYNGEFGISRGQIQKLAKKLSARDKINYRHLTDVLTDLDGNVRHTPAGADDVVETDDLIRGYGINLAKMSDEFAKSDQDAKPATVDGDVMVVNGSVVNVGQRLKLLKQVEHERDVAKSTVNEQLSLIDQLREAKIEIEKKKKDIESQYAKSNKKLSDTTTQLKTVQEEYSSLKQALQDCKRHADRIFSVVEKALPKKEEKPREKERERKDEKVEEKPVAAEKTTADGEAEQTSNTAEVEVAAGEKKDVEGEKKEEKKEAAE
uniref:SAP domain-containing ribonucleoprotein n=1 Tax=Caenorhabditis japonica TaxID=281687 RepID=A0A8R1HXL3_CAEJA